MYLKWLIFLPKLMFLVKIPVGNRDNHRYSPNENLKPGNYFDGVKTIYALLNTALTDERH